MADFNATKFCPSAVRALVSVMRTPFSRRSARHVRSRADQWRADRWRGTASVLLGAGRHRAARVALLAVIACAVIFFASLPAVVAQSRLGRSDSTTAQPFRIIRAPSKTIERLATGEYRPVLRDEFQERLAALSRDFPEQLSQGVAITQANYTGRLEGRRLLVGNARWQVELLADEPRWLSIGTPQLALSDVRWIREEAFPSEADFGSLSDGSCLLHVPRSGRLQARWSLTPLSVTDEELTFQLELPPSGISQLDLQVPREFELLPEFGIVRRLELTEDPAAAEISPGSSPAIDVWQWDLGGHDRSQLRMRRRDAPPRRPAVRQVNRYAISEQGLELSVDLQLDCDAQPLANLALAIDSELRVTKVTYRNESLPWTIATDDPASHRVVIRFPQPLRGLGQPVRITAIAPPQAYRHWSLPRVRVGDELRWLQESARLRVAAPFRIQNVRTEQAIRLPSTGDLPSSTPTLAFQFQDPSYQVHLTLTDEAPKNEYRTATQVLVRPNEILATVRVNVRSRASENFDVFAAVREGWDLESLESERNDLMDESPVLSSPSATRDLRLRFREPLPIDRWTRLTLRLRRPLPTNQDPLSLGLFQPLVFDSGADPPRRFLTLEVAAGLEIVYPQSNGLTWLGIDDLDASEASLLGAQTGERLILMDESAVTQPIAIRKRADATAVVSATTEVHANIDARRVTQQFRIEVERQSGKLDRLHVEMTRKRDEDIRWYLEGAAAGRELTARRLPETVGGEVWEIDWPEFAADRAVLVGERSWATTGEEHLALARVREARTQSGTVLIEGPPELTVRRSGAPLFTPILEPPAATPSAVVRRYAYRYTPIFDENALLAIQLTPLSEDSPWLVIWRLTTAAQIDQAGITRYDATLWAENLGSDSVRVRLPENCAVRQVLVDGTEPSYQADERGMLRIPLPSRERFPCIQIRYDHAGEAWTWWNSHVRRELTIVAPVLRRDYQIWTPPDFGVARTELPALGDLANEFLGGLARPDDEPFNFFSPASWQRLAQPWIREPDQLDQAAERLIRALGQSDIGSVGAWLDAVSALNVWIDYDRLSDRKVTPRTPLAIGSGSDDFTRGLDRLRHLRLGIIDAGDLVLITSDQGIASVPSAQPTYVSHWIVRYPDARRPIRASGISTELDALASWMPAARWHEAQLTWQQADLNLAPHVVTGWRAYGLNKADRAPATIYRVQHLTLIRCVAFIVGIAAAWWLARYRLRRGLLIAALFAAAAFVLPATAALIAISALWGSILGLWLPLLHPDELPTLADRSTVASRMTRESATTGFCLWLVLIAGAAIGGWHPAKSLGQERPAAASGEQPAAQVWQVFVPSNDRGEPEGKYVYVPLALHQALWSDSVRTPGQPPSWTLIEANYDGVLEPSADQSRLELTTINADFELMVTQDQGVVPFPLAPEAAAALRREAFLDGRPVQLQWDAVRSALLLPIRQSGRHHLQVSFSTVTVVESGRARMRFPIPATPQAALLLTSPQDLQSLEIPSSRGAILRREATGQLRAELGPTDRLEITWPVATADDAPPMIDQLSWLRLDRAELRLDVHLVVDARRYARSTVVVEADERLQLDVPRSDQPLSLAPAPEPGARRFEFSLPPNDGQAVIRMSFLMSGSTGVGTTVYPHLRVLDQPVTHYLGISAGAGLSLRVQPGNATALAVNEYATRWGGAEAPDYAYSFGSEIRNWSCQTQQIRSTTQIDLQTVYACGQHETTALHLATVRADQSMMFQLPLELDAGCELEAVQVLPGTNGQLVRWERITDQGGTLQFAEPLSGSFQLGIVCRQRGAAVGARALPRIRFPDASVDVRTVDLYRRSDALLPDVESEPDAAAPELPPFLRNRLGLARWKARWDAPPKEDAWTVHVAANQRDLQATVTSIVDRDAGNWMLRLQIDMKRSTGVLDAITLEIPAAWTAWLQDDAAMRVLFAQSMRPEMARITVWPLSGPLDTRQPIELNGPIPTVPGQPLSVPNVKLLEDGSITQRVFLPQMVEGQAVLWDPIGLRPLGEAVPPPKNALLGADYRGFEVVEERFEAIRTPVNRTIGDPRVHLADLHILPDADGSYLGLALFDVSPAGLEQCFVEFPRELEPRLLSVEQQAQRLERNDDGARIAVRLLSKDLPQQIRVLFQGRMAVSPGKETHLLTPRLVTPNLSDRAASMRPLPVEQTLWTVHAPAGARWRFADPTADWDVQQTHRRQRLRQRMEQVEQRASELTTRDLSSWYAKWCERFVAATRQTRILAAFDADSDTESVRAALDQAIADETDRSRRLQTEAIWQRAAAQEQIIDLNGLWHRTVGAGESAVRFAFEGTHEALTFRVPPTSSQEPTRAVLVGLILVSASLLQWRPRRLAWFSPRWPALWGVLFGIGWWLFLQPSVIGWVIVGLSLLLAALLR